MKKQIIKAKTFTPIYDEIEDRIRLVINYKDPYNRIDLMITRAFIIRLIPMLEEYLENNFNISLESNKDIKKDINFTTKTDTDYIDFILKEELLKEVNISLLEDKTNILMKFSSKSCEVNALINSNILKELVKNIKSAIPKFSWSLNI